MAFGVIQVTDEPGTLRLRQSIVQHLHADSQMKKLKVARHHFPLKLLEFNGTGKKRVGGIELQKIVGADGKSAKQFKTAIPKELAEKVGIFDAAELFTTDKNDRSYGCYVQAPVAAYSDVKAYVDALTAKVSLLSKAGSGGGSGGGSSTMGIPTTTSTKKSSHHQQSSDRHITAETTTTKKRRKKASSTDGQPSNKKSKSKTAAGTATGSSRFPPTSANKKGSKLSKLYPRGASYVGCR